MDREVILAYLKDIKRILHKRFEIQWIQKYMVQYYQINNIISQQCYLDDEELLEWAHQFENIKPLSFDD
jgi:hypothetical protein